MTINSPRHDPGHRRGGAAPSGLPQAQTLAQSAAALSAHWVAEAPKGFMVKQEQLARPVSPEYSICEPQPTCSARSGGVRARKPRRTAPTMPELMKLYQYFLIISECVVNGHDCFYRESTLLISGSQLFRARGTFLRAEMDSTPPNHTRNESLGLLAGPNAFCSKMLISFYMEGTILYPCSQSVKLSLT